MLYKFIGVWSKKLLIFGSILQTKVIKLAEKINTQNFKTSNGWLENLRKGTILFGNKSMMR